MDETEGHESGPWLGPVRLKGTKKSKEKKEERQRVASMLRASASYGSQAKRSYCSFSRITLPVLLQIYIISASVSV